MKQTPRLGNENTEEVDGKINLFHRIMIWLASIQFNIYNGLILITRVNRKLLKFSLSGRGSGYKN